VDAKNFYWTRKAGLCQFRISSNFAFFVSHFRLSLSKISFGTLLVQRLIGRIAWTRFKNFFYPPLQISHSYFNVPQSRKGVKLIYNNSPCLVFYVLQTRTFTVVWIQQRISKAPNAVFKFF